MERPKGNEKEKFSKQALPDFFAPLQQNEIEIAFEIRRCPGFSIREDFND